MLELPSLRPETRYGMPTTADQLLFNRHYITGYSFMFRQARWAMEVIDPTNCAVEVDRGDSFRVDPRVPPEFRSELDHYKLKDQDGKRYDRGHVVCSADRLHSEAANSETFLLSNMSPQVGVGFNRGVWRYLEAAIREELSRKDDVIETYVIAGPVFLLNKPVRSIGNTPVPHAFFKSVLAESNRGALDQWTFLIPNGATEKDFWKFQVPCVEVEKATGMFFWDRNRDPDFLHGKTILHAPW